MQSTVDNGQTLDITGNAVFNGVVGGTPLTSLSVSGTSDINTTGISTTGSQGYNGNVTLGANTTLTGTMVSFGGLVTGAGNDLTVTCGSPITLALSSITGVAAFTSNGGSTSTVSGTLTTTGAQVWTDAVTLNGTTVLDGTTVSFGGLVTGAGNDLTVTCGSPITLALSSITGVAAFTSNGGSTSTVSGTLTTTGAQIWTDAVLLGGATTLEGPMVTLQSTVDNGQTLDITGNAVFGGVVGGTPLASLSVSGTSAINTTGISTTGSQGYTGAVTLGANTTLTGTTMTFGGTVDNGQTLDITGNAVFNGVVGGTPLTSLSVSGTSAINTTGISTTGSQGYTGAVTLGSDTVLTGTVVTFSAAVDGGTHDLTLTCSNPITLTLSTITGVVNFTSNGGSTSTVSGTLTTTGTQTWTDAVLLGGATTLEGPTVTLQSTVDNGQSLDITGNAVFGGVVGGTPLASLSVSGTSDVNTTGITTTGNQGYTGAVTLGSTTTLTTGNSNVSFLSTVDAAAAGVQGLTVAAGSGQVSFGDVTGTTSLADITITGTGGITLRSVTTTGTQGYTGAVTLGATATLSTTNSPVSFSATVDAGTAGVEGLTVTTGTGDIIVSGILGGTKNLSSVNMSGNDITFNGIGNGGNGAAAVTATASDNGPDGGRITLQGAGDYRTSGAQVYNSGNVNGEAGILVAISGNSTMEAGVAGITLDEVYTDFDPLVTLTTGATIHCERFVAYRGTLDLGGATITADQVGSGDIIIYGNSYSSNDAGRNLTFPGNTFFAYPDEASMLYYPGGGTVVDITAANLNSVFSDTALLTITVSAGNFYVNGATMDAGAWTLNNRDSSDTAGLDFNTPSGWPYGDIYATAFNGTIGDSTAMGSAVAAAEATDGTGTTNWDFTALSISAAATVYDNVIRVEFSDPVENGNNEIWNAVAFVAASSDLGGLWLNSTGTEVRYTGAYTSALCTPASALNLTTADQTVIYLKTTGATWNTDATGADAGDSNSTDRRGNARNYPLMPDPIVPDITLLKGLLYKADGHNLVQSYNATDLFAVYSGAVDECRPALVNVVAGLAEHNPAASDEIYDAHNYFHLRYSEPVNIGTGAGFTIADCTAVNIRAESTFDAGAEHGGDIVDGGSTVSVTGFFSYSGRLPNDASDGLPSSTFYRDNTGGENPSGTHGITLYIAAYRTDDTAAWPGYIGTAGADVSLLPTLAALTSVGETVTVTENDFIKDASANILEPSSDTYDAWVPTVEAPDAAGNFGDGNLSLALPVDDEPGWDVDTPGFTTYESGFAEIVSRADIVSGFVNRLEFHILDDWVTGDGGWDPETDHPDPVSGVRDSSWGSVLAIEVEEVGVTDLTSEHNLTYNTDVSNALFGTINADDDAYFALNIDTADHGWNLQSELWISYDSSLGFITDLAGNLIPSQTTPIRSIERVPPYISLSLSTVGGDKVYVKFSEPVFGFDGVNLETLDIGHFNPAVGNGTTLTGIDILSVGDNGGALEAFFYLSDPLTENLSMSGTLKANVDSVADKLENIMLASQVHRVTDVAAGIIEPVWASDGLHADAESGSTLTSSLRDFDGTGDLMDQDITLEVSVLADSYTSLPVQLFYDVDPQGTVTADSGLWLPSFVSSELPPPNSGSRGLSPIRSEGAVRDFVIPASDPEMAPGNDVEFVLKLGNIFAMRSTSTDDPRELAPWVIQIRDIRRQSGGVTILNNVINPSFGDETVITYNLERRGMVTINVFSLSGDVVKILHRGPQGSGSYSYTWDGTNRTGTTVARGIYFIRVVGPDIDEYRKVIVAR